MSHPPFHEVLSVADDVDWPIRCLMEAPATYINGVPNTLPLSYDLLECRQKLYLTAKLSAETKADREASLVLL
jgi:hypothetical protein